MEFNSTATFAFESIAKRHGENTCFSYRDFKSIHQVNIKVKRICLILIICMDPLHFQYLKTMRLYYSGVLEDSIFRIVFSIVHCVKYLVLKNPFSVWLLIAQWVNENHEWWPLLDRAPWQGLSRVGYSRCTLANGTSSSSEYLSLAELVYICFEIHFRSIRNIHRNCI